MSCGPRSVEISGGSGTETVGIMGKALDRDGQPVAGAAARLRRHDYLDTAAGRLFKTDTIARNYLVDGQTNGAGKFFFSSVDTGIYFIEINDGRHNAALMPCTVSRIDSLIVLPDTRLLPTGSLFGTIPPAPQTDSMPFSIAVYGLADHIQTTTRSGEFTLLDLPQGVYTIKIISNGPLFTALDTAINIVSGQTDTIGVSMPRTSFSVYPFDSCIVRAILDSNGLYGTSVSKVAQIDSKWPFRITGISFYYKNISTLTSLIGSLSELSTIDIQGAMRMSTLPPEIGACKKIRTLTVKNGQLDSLPPAIGDLDSLRQLYVSGNNLTSLPPELGRLQALEVLDAGNNSLKSVPWDIRWCRSLQGLYLDNNFIEEFHLDISAFAQIEFVDLENNLLWTLPSQITGVAAQSSFINVNGNKLCTSVAADIKAWLDTYSTQKDWQSSQQCY